MTFTKYIAGTLLPVLVIAVTVVSPALAAEKYVPNQLIVTFKKDVSSKKRNDLLGRFGGGPLAKAGKMRGGTVQAKDPAKFNDLLSRLKKSALVEKVEKDAYIYSSKTPNDPFFSTLQYSLNAKSTANLGASKAWEKKTSCKKKKVAVLDTGVDTNHPDLKDNLWVNSDESDNGRDDDGNGYIDDIYGGDMLDRRGSGEDLNGHGTHVSGTIGARSDNSTGVTGVCWKAKIISVRFMNAFGAGPTSAAIAGIDYAVQEGAKVINASFGSSTKSSALEDAIERAQEKGVLIVAAAGNEAANIDKVPVYPASYTNSNILVVAASTANDKLASFSNYGEGSVDVAAPGEAIASTYIGGLYVEMSGTSMAAPLASGLAALLFSTNSAADYKDVRKAIRKKVDKPSALNNKVAYDGRVDLYKAIDYIEDVE